MNSLTFEVVARELCSWIPGSRIGSLFYYGSLRLIFILF